MMVRSLRTPFGFGNLRPVRLNAGGALCSNSRPPAHFYYETDLPRDSQRRGDVPMDVPVKRPCESKNDVEVPCRTELPANDPSLP